LSDNSTQSAIGYAPVCSDPIYLQAMSCMLA
jgi:hypothetical protein